MKSEMELKLPSIHTVLFRGGLAVSGVRLYTPEAMLPKGDCAGALGVYTKRFLLCPRETE